MMLKKITVLLLLFSFSQGFLWAQNEAEPQKKTSFKFGTCSHFGFDKGQLKTDVRMAKIAGIKFFRDELSWGAVEKPKGVMTFRSHYKNFINETQKNDIGILNILCYGNGLYDNGDFPRSKEAVDAYVKYAEFIVKNLPSENRLVQVWNEWDYGTGMHGKKGDLKSYLKLLSAVYPKLKAVDPSVTVIANSFITSVRLEEMVKMGMLKYCDAVALHTYNYWETKGPDAPEKWYAKMLNTEKNLKRLNNGKVPDLYITEMGYPTHIGMNGSTYQAAASKLARVYLLGKTLPFVKGIWCYDFIDDGWDYKNREDNFGLLKPDSTPKPAWYVLRDIADIINNAEYVGRLKTDDPNIWALRFRHSDGHDIITAWSGHVTGQWQVVFNNADSKLSEISVHHAGRKRFERDWGYRDWINAPHSPKRNQLSFTLDNMPLILEGELDKVSISKVIEHKFPEKKRTEWAKVTLPKRWAVVKKKGTAMEVYSVDTAEYYRGMDASKWGGADDLSFTFSSSYDSNNLYLNIMVKDNMFQQEFSAENTWNGDGLQMAFMTADASGVDDRTEIDVALTPKGPEAYLRCNRLNLPYQVCDKVKTKATKEKGKVFYSITIPASIFKLKSFEKGTMLTATILVNDNDGGMRKGYMSWGEGIGNSKDPSKYNLLLLQ